MKKLNLIPFIIAVVAFGLVLTGGSKAIASLIVNSGWADVEVARAVVATGGANAI